MAFPTKMKGNHHLQGEVQVYNVRIPVSVGLYCHPELGFALHSVTWHPLTGEGADGEEARTWGPERHDAPRRLNASVTFVHTLGDGTC